MQYLVLVTWHGVLKTKRNCIIVDSEKLAKDICSLFFDVPYFEANYYEVKSPCTEQGKIKE